MNTSLKASLVCMKPRAIDDAARSIWTHGPSDNSPVPYKETDDPVPFESSLLEPPTPAFTGSGGGDAAFAALAAASRAFNARNFSPLRAEADPLPLVDTLDAEAAPLLPLVETTSTSTSSISSPDSSRRFLRAPSSLPVGTGVGTGFWKMPRKLVLTQSEAALPAVIKPPSALPVIPTDPHL
ncbi:hypothetical protein Vretimale_16203 [Volvox reticuliferus]|uniref:Uncharacterized protein n=1 Tax=Volvox reticuliferus TaxID=1737510 RepID=A0A8J4GTH4_9CHLO|nr:hypothetical protein Vretimale_16203 [Volvox reticuliferus]